MKCTDRSSPGAIPYALGATGAPSKNLYIFIPAVLMHFDAAAGILGTSIAWPSPAGEKVVFLGSGSALVPVERKGSAASDA
jgi:hypothetical protein